MTIPPVAVPVVPRPKPARTGRLRQVEHHLRLVAKRRHIEAALESLTNLPDQIWELRPSTLGVPGVAVDEKHQVGLAGVVILPDLRPMIIEWGFTLDHRHTPMLKSGLLPYNQHADP